MCKKNRWFGKAVACLQVELHNSVGIRYWSGRSVMYINTHHCGSVSAHCFLYRTWELSFHSILFQRAYVVRLCEIWPRQQNQHLRLLAAVGQWTTASCNSESGRECAMPETSWLALWVWQRFIWQRSPAADTHHSFRHYIPIMNCTSNRSWNRACF